MNEIVNLINTIKQVHDREYVEITGDLADVVFQYHHCYYFAKLLQKFYPEGEFYIKNDGSHIALKVGNYLYDSKGAFIDNDFRPVEGEDWISIEAIMIPSNKILREKLNKFVDDIYNEIEALYYSESNKLKR